MPHLLDLALVQDDDLVGDLERLLLVVGDEQAGDVDLVVQPAEPAAQLVAHPGVERPERLVEQQHLGLDGERPGQRHALALAAGELRRVPLGVALELHQVEQLVDPLPDLASSGRLRISSPNATFWRIVMWRNSGVVLEARTRRRGPATGRFVASSPVSSTVPESAGSSPAMIRRIVLLPDPTAQQRHELAGGDLERDAVDGLESPNRFERSYRDTHVEASCRCRMRTSRHRRSPPRIVTLGCHRDRHRASGSAPCRPAGRTRRRPARRWRRRRPPR